MIGENQHPPEFKEKLSYLLQTVSLKQSSLIKSDDLKDRIRNRRGSISPTQARGLRRGGPDKSTRKPGESLSQKGIIFSKFSVQMCILTRDVFQFLSVFIYKFKERSENKITVSYMFNQSALFGKIKKNT